MWIKLIFSRKLNHQFKHIHRGKTRLYKVSGETRPAQDRRNPITNKANGWCRYRHMSMMPLCYRRRLGLFVSLLIGLTGTSSAPAKHTHKVL